MAVNRNYDVSKLPKWAQRELGRLERDLAYERAKLTAGPADSDTFADHYSSAPRPLGEGTSIQFVFARREDDSPRSYITARIEKDQLYVSGSDSLAVRPRSSNALYVELARDG